MTRQSLGEARQVDAELLGQDGHDAVDLHLADPGERHEPRLEVGTVSRLAPYSAGIPAVLIGDRLRQGLHSLGHGAREPMQGRTLAEGPVQLGGIGAGDPGWIEVAQPAAQVDRSRKRLLHGHLLIEREPDQQRQGIAGDQLVGLVGVGEVQPIWHQ